MSRPTSYVRDSGYLQNMTGDGLKNTDLEHHIDAPLINSQLLSPIESHQIRIKHSNHKHAKRIALFFSSIAALASGTPYLYGVYSPQLITRCGFSALDSSYLSFAGNIGSSIGGFFAGLIIDKFGVRFGLVLGAFLEFTGFFLFYINYKYALHNFFHLIFSMCCIGFGSVLAYFATIKVATLNFPKHRGFANACPVSSYGLAALFYAFVSTFCFAGNTEGLLKFIALFSGISIAFSSIFIKIYEKDDEDEDDNFIHDEADNDSSDENEFETGLKYLMKGHRGSFAQVNNIMRNDSASSLFSDISDVSSLMTNSTTSLSRDSSLQSISSLHPISINSQQHVMRSNSNFSSSPLDFKAKQSLVRSGSFRMGTSFSSSPRNSRLFGSITQKSQKFFLTDESPLLPSSGEGNTRANSSYPSSLVTTSSSTNLASSNTHKTSSDLKNVAQSDHANNSITGSNLDSLNITNYNSASQASETNLSRINDTTNASTKKVKRNRKKKLTTKEHINQLFHDRIFKSYYVLNAFYCAVGQVYIFGIGFIVRAQVNYYRLHKPTSFVLKLALYLSNSSKTADIAVTNQALQVSIISFSNFLGRLISGPASDLIHKKLRMSKIYVVIISLIVLLMGQVSLLLFNKLDYLSLTSFFIGLAYGSIYGTMPSIVADSFGSTHFATTWALLGTGPIAVFLVLSDYFGTYYDSNSEWGYIGDEKVKICLKGKECYKNVFELNSVICVVLLLGYIWLLIVSAKKVRQ